MTISTFTDLQIETKRKEDNIEYVGLDREPIGQTINSTSAFQALSLSKRKQDKNECVVLALYCLKYLIALLYCLCSMINSKEKSKQTCFNLEWP